MWHVHTSRAAAASVPSPLAAFVPPTRRLASLPRGCPSPPQRRRRLGSGRAAAVSAPRLPYAKSRKEALAFRKGLSTKLLAPGALRLAVTGAGGGIV